jgi:hypothetical protein
MSPRAHLWLRLGALALLASAAVWPRASRHAPSATHELVRTRTPQQVQQAERHTARTDAFAQSPQGPQSVNLVVADVDESRLTN